MRADFKVVEVDCSSIEDERSFHRIFAEKFEFPSYYAHTMEGWEHCLSELDNGESPMTNVVLKTGQFLVLHLVRYPQLRRRLPDLCVELNERVAWLNWLRVSRRQAPLILLAYHSDEVAG